MVAVDIRESSRKDALTYGADEALSPQEALAQYGSDADHPGFEMVMEWGETNESLDTAIQLTRMCGQLCVGAYHPREANLTDTGARNAAEMLGRGAWNYKNIPTMIYPMNRFD